MYSIKLLLLKEQSCSTPGDAERSNWTSADVQCDTSGLWMCCSLLWHGLYICIMASNPSWEALGTLEVNDRHFLPSPQCSRCTGMAAGVSDLNLKVTRWGGNFIVSFNNSCLICTSEVLNCALTLLYLLVSVVNGDITSLQSKRTKCLKPVVLSPMSQ